MAPHSSTSFLRRDPAVAPTPREALLRFRGRPGLVLLESAGEGGRYSLLASDPVAVIPEPGGNPFDALEQALAGGVSMPPPPEIPFPGGIIGYLGYEAGDRLERLPSPPTDDVGIPEAWFGIYEWAVVWDRETGQCHVGGTVLPDRDPAELGRTLDRAVDWLSDPAAGERTADAAPRPAAPAPPPAPGRTLDRERYMAGVDRIREYIRAGDLFQANLTRRISRPTPFGGVELYLRMVRESPAPFAACLDTGEVEIASISPEAFLSLRGREVETRPIKGTAPRGRDADEDLRLRTGLVESEKDRAENVMIVDLLRNDLSRVCEDDSVEVPRLLEVESHPTVHHLVSTVTGRLREGVGAVDLLRATFPGGSITGAPKIRAMEVLRELEPARRGVYTGAIGVLGFHGDLELSIAIRTAVVRGGWAHYGTGGGITLASDPEGEWEESEVKARAFLRALEADGEGAAWS